MTRARQLSKLGNANVLSVDSSNNVGIGSLTPDAKLDVVGIVSATSFSGSGANLTGIVAGATLSAGSGAQRVVATGLTSGTMTAAATDADLSWNSSTNTLSAPTLSGNITGTAATFSGSVSVGGTLTHGDVTSVDSVGVVTARSGIKVGAGESISPVSGTITYYGDGSNLTGVELGTKNFVASGTIDNGKTVIIKDDGTVGIVTLTTSNTPEAGSEVVFESASSLYPAAAYDSTNGKVVIAYRDEGNSNYGTAIVGTVSGTSISFGSAQTFNLGATGYISAAYDSDIERVVIAYVDGGNSNYGTAVVGTVSGTSISFGSEYAFNSASTGYTATVYDTTNDKIVIAYQDSGNSNYGTAIVGTVSGTSISFGSEYTFESATVDSGMSAAYVGSGKVVMAYRDDGNSYKGTAIVGTVSGTSISFGASAVFDSGPASITFISATYDSTNDKVAIAYRDNWSPNYGYAVVGTVSGTDITFGSVVLMTAADTRTIFTTYDSTNDRVIVCYRDAGNSNYGTAIVGTVVGTAITFGSEVVFNSGTTTQIGCTFDSTNGKTVIAFSDDSNSSYGTAVVFSSTSQQTNLTSENYIGISGESIANAATGKISVVGGVNSGQSGLTTAKTYYVSPPTGILTTTAGSPSVVAGTSISDTEILVWRS